MLADLLNIEAVLGLVHARGLWVISHALLQLDERPVLQFASLHPSSVLAFGLDLLDLSQDFLINLPLVLLHGKMV